MNAIALFRFIINRNTMETTVLQRIKSVIDYVGKSERAFSICIGVAPMTINSLFKRNSDPSFSTLYAIANTFDYISTDWLILGKGEMLRTEPADNSTQIRTLEDRVLVLETENNLLKGMQAGLNATQRNVG